MTIDPSLFVTRMQALDSAMTSLGPALEAAAPTGDFQAALDDANAALAEAVDPSTSGASSGSGSQATASGAGSPVVPSSLAGLSPTTPGQPVAGTSPATAGSGVTGASVVSDAERYLGVPYQWGGTSPSTGFDCSGLVQHVYGDLGISLPRTSQEQATVGTPVADLADAQPGDLVFFEPGPSGPGHVGIYIGDGQMIDAPHTGTDVQIQPVGQPSEIRRVLPTTTSPATTPTTGATATGATPTPGVPSTIPADLDVPADLVPLFQAAGAQHEVPPALLAAVAKHESDFEPNAVSSAGAEGIMQIMPGTAAGLGVNPFDPAQAIEGAAQLLGGYLKQYGGSVPLALAAYDAGPGAVAEYGGVPPYPETTAYISSIATMLGEGS